MYYKRKSTSLNDRTTCFQSDHSIFKIKVLRTSGSTQLRIYLAPHLYSEAFRLFYALMFSYRVYSDLAIDEHREQVESLLKQL